MLCFIFKVSWSFCLVCFKYCKGVWQWLEVTCLFKLTFDFFSNSSAVSNEQLDFLDLIKTDLPSVYMTWFENGQSWAWLGRESTNRIVKLLTATPFSCVNRFSSVVFLKEKVITLHSGGASWRLPDDSSVARCGSLCHSGLLEGHTASSALQ